MFEAFRVFSRFRDLQDVTWGPPTDRWSLGYDVITNRIIAVRAPNPMTAAGDMIVADLGGTELRVAKGADNYVWKMNPSTHLPQWLPDFYVQGIGGDTTFDTLEDNSLTIKNNFKMYLGDGGTFLHESGIAVESAPLEFTTDDGVSLALLQFYPPGPDQSAIKLVSVSGVDLRIGASPGNNVTFDDGGDTYHQIAETKSIVFKNHLGASVFQVDDTGVISGGYFGNAITYNVGTSAGQLPVLDGAGLLPTSILPALAITSANVVASQAAMLALSAQTGDIAIRTDQNKSYILSTNSPGTLADWKELLSPTDLVTSVAGRTGNVVLTNADISGLGGAAVLNVGTAAGTVAAGDHVHGTSATGDIIFRNSSGVLTRLAIGAANTVLRVSGGLPSWAAITGTAPITVTGLAISHAASGVAAGTYGRVVVNATGHVTGADNGAGLSYLRITANATAAPATCTYNVDASDNDVTLLLPAAPSTDEVHIVLAEGVGEGFTITIDANGKSIMGDSTRSLITNQAVMLQWDNVSDWRVVGAVAPHAAGDRLGLVITYGAALDPDNPTAPVLQSDSKISTDVYNGILYRAGGATITAPALSTTVAFSSDLPSTNYRVALTQDGATVVATNATVTNKTIHGFDIVLSVGITVNYDWYAAMNQ